MLLLPSFFFAFLPLGILLCIDPALELWHILISWSDESGATKGAFKGARTKMKREWLIATASSAKLVQMCLVSVSSVPNGAPLHRLVLLVQIITSMFVLVFIHTTTLRQKHKICVVIEAAVERERRNPSASSVRVREQSRISACTLGSNQHNSGPPGYRSGTGPWPCRLVLGGHCTPIARGTSTGLKVSTRTTPSHLLL
ncbi:hypothetical protein V2G26_014104 [Clonostachys chloroleuca]